MKKTLYIISSFLILISVNAEQNAFFYDLKDNHIDLAEDVFIFSSSKEKNKLSLSWDIKEGYYLYLSSISIEKDDLPVDYKIDEADILFHQDEFFGETKIIRETLRISLKDSDQTSNSKIFYQGCSDKGFCYPIQTINLK
jgi:thiol:disulfide interchange protein DsbD